MSTHNSFDELHQSISSIFHDSSMSFLSNFCEPVDDAESSSSSILLLPLISASKALIKLSNLSSSPSSPGDDSSINDIRRAPLICNPSSPLMKAKPSQTSDAIFCFLSQER
ncbi:hypothetical protein V8G54_025644 [Vigna mungo]|uniref:Uncharacterized protein n=1 Tax=Vigna mungo TaxID=3915 RepID=A0AAQ3MZ44_VIGMU